MLPHLGGHCTDSKVTSGQLPLLSDDNLTERRSPSCPKLGQQQKGVAALQLWALCTLQSLWSSGQGHKIHRGRAAAQLNHFFPQLLIFITKGQRLCVMKVQRI